MSTSIQKNKLAVQYINNAKDNLKSAVMMIEGKNNNSQTDEIINLLNDSIEHINGLEDKIDGINSNILDNEKITKGDKK